jgi:uncharacterized membrane protein YbhN (UPF0104 family)
MTYPCIKAAQFDRIARIYGSQATLGQHCRAYFYGDGLDRVLPFNMGRVALAKTMERHGMDPKAATEAVFIALSFTIFEIVAFAIVGLFMLGWTDWFSQILWALIFLMVAYYLVRPKDRMSVVPPASVAVRVIGDAFSRIAQASPGMFIQLCVLSLVAFSLFDLATFITMTSFDTAIVLINVETPVLLMGIVGGYIAAKLIPVTPGGIGQWEIGFATGLTIGGSDVSVALVSIAFLTNMLRIGTGTLLMGGTVLGYKSLTSLREIGGVFASREPIARRSVHDRPHP